MNNINVLSDYEVDLVSGGLIAEIAFGIAGLAITEFGLGYSIGKDLANNDK